MTTSEHQRRVYSRLDDDPNAPSGVTPKEVLDALNEGQEIASLLTLCFPITVNLPLTAGTPFYNLRQTLPDFLMPLALRVAGARIAPSTLAEMDALDDGWQAAAATPKRYALLGFHFLAITPQPTTDTVAQFTYARTPKPLVLDKNPELPTQFQPALEDYALWRVTLKEGAAGLERAKGYLARYFEAIKALGDSVRARSRTARYDVLPFELQIYDRRQRLAAKKPTP